MAKVSAVPGWQRALVVLTGTVVGVVVVGCLYWAQRVFIPVALAVFLTFLLAPLVSFLQRRHLGRAPAVVLVVLLTALLLGGVIWLVTAEVTSLARELADRRPRRYAQRHGQNRCRYRRAQDPWRYRR